MLKEYPLFNTVTEFVSTFTDSRYKSWEHCFSFFEKEVYNYIGKAIPEEILDHASLHLAFYLASWGMMRGSTFLLQSDYKVHKKLIRDVLLNKDYELLWNFDFSTSSQAKISDYLYLVLDKDNGIKNKVINSYPNLKNSQGRISNPSDTLITKILMGTLGCIPAYDRYFMEGLGYANINYSGNIDFIQKLGHNSLKSLILFINQNIEELYSLNNSLEMQYPIMKLVDMYFWTIGLNEEKAKKQKIR